MKKLLYLTLLTVGLFSCADKTDICVEQIKNCINNKTDGGEACFSKAMNQYCGTDFDVYTNQWWYDMQDWVKESESNKNKLIKLSDKLKEEATDKGYKDLIWIAEEAIDEDLLDL